MGIWDVLFIKVPSFQRLLLSQIWCLGCPVYQSALISECPDMVFGMSCLSKCPHFRESCLVKYGVWDVLFIKVPSFQSVLL